MFSSGREPPLTDERADISGILRLFFFYTDECDEASGSVYGFLPPADSPLLFRLQLRNLWH